MTDQLNLVLDQAARKGVSKRQAVAEKLVSLALEGETPAITAIFNRIEGMPVQPTRSEDPPKDMGPLRELGIEKIRLLIQLMKRYTPEELEKLAGIAERHDQESVGVGKGQSQGE